MNPRNVYVLVPMTCGYMLCYGAKELCRQDDIKDLEVGRFSGLSSYVQCNHTMDLLHAEGQEGQIRGKGLGDVAVLALKVEERP